MYESFTIRNFRGFHDLEFAPLTRVNLITGANNVGKTALLEGIFLHLGVNNPQIPLRVNIIRGIERFKIQPEDLWGWLFFAKRLSEPIILTSIDDRGVSRTVEIALVVPETSHISAQDRDTTKHSAAFSSAALEGPRELVLSYHDSLGNKTDGRVFISTSGELEARLSSRASLPQGIYLSTRSRFVHEDAERYSNLERVGKHESILPILRLMEPRLTRIAVVISGGMPLISGDIGIGELIPLPLMGEGMVRLMSILLAITNSPGGVVLIDEIENGLHHSVMNRIFEAVGMAARTHDTQVFATTHSWECIRAAHDAFSAAVQEWRLHRLEQVSGQIRDYVYDEDSLSASLRADLEVR